MCRSLADGGKRCPNIDRFRKMGTRDVAPESVDGVPALAWDYEGSDAMQRAWAYMPQAACCAIELLREVRKEEPVITSDVMAAAGVTGAWCHGLEHRMKSPFSLARKLNSAFDDLFQHGRVDDDLGAVARSEGDDALRYTVCVESGDELVPTLGSMIRELRAKGWQFNQIKDSYLDGNTYKGLHLIARAPGPAQRDVEIQVHSRASIAVKDSIHGDYEIARDSSMSDRKRQQAAQRCADASEILAMPRGLGGCYRDGVDEGEVEGVRMKKKNFSPAGSRRREQR